MVQDMQQGQHMLFVAAELGLPNIVHNHVPDFFAAVFMGQKVPSERRCNDFGKVFVLGDGEHLFFGQAAESNAILKCDHVHSTPLRAVLFDHLVSERQQRHGHLERL
jgi:hypothetical protein